MTDAYDEALKWYKKGMEDAHQDGAFAPEYVDKHFHKTYGSQVPQEVVLCRAEHGHLYELSIGKKYFSGSDAALIEFLLELPPADRIKVMGLSAQELDEYVKQEKAVLINALEIVFKSSWVDRVEDQPIDWMDAQLNNYRFGLPYGSKALLAHFRAGRLNVLSFADQIFRFVKEECKPWNVKDAHAIIFNELELL